MVFFLHFLLDAALAKIAEFGKNSVAVRDNDEESGTLAEHKSTGPEDAVAQGSLTGNTELRRRDA